MMHMFKIQGASWQLAIPDNIMEQLGSYAQKGWFSKESTGQLYSSDFSSDTITVDLVTKHKPRWALRAEVQLDLKSIDEERRKMFSRGLHCLGFWHTHPEPHPTPSPADLTMAAEQARAGRPDFNGLVFVIIGNAPCPQSVGVWVHDGSALWEARPHLPVHD